MEPSDIQIAKAEIVNEIRTARNELATGVASIASAAKRLAAMPAKYTATLTATDKAAQANAALAGENAVLQSLKDEFVALRIVADAKKAAVQGA